MSGATKRTFSLTAEQAAFIDRKVQKGEYASASEVVRAGLRALKEHDAAVTEWLRREVLPTYERIKAGTEPLIPAEQVYAKLGEHIAERKRQRRRSA